MEHVYLEYLWQIALIILIEITLFGGGVWSLITGYYDEVKILLGVYLIAIGTIILFAVLGIKL